MVRGTGEAARSEGALQEILQQIDVVTVQTKQIATAAEEQTATTALISDNIQQVTRAVQGTARDAQSTSTCRAPRPHTVDIHPTG